MISALRFTFWRNSSNRSINLLSPERSPLPRRGDIYQAQADTLCLPSADLRKP